MCSPSRTRITRSQWGREIRQRQSDGPLWAQEDMIRALAPREMSARSGSPALATCRLGETQGVHKHPSQLVNRLVKAAVNGLLHEPHLSESACHCAERRGCHGRFKLGIRQPVLLKVPDCHRDLLRVALLALHTRRVALFVVSGHLFDDPDDLGLLAIAFQMAPQRFADTLLRWRVGLRVENHASKRGAELFFNRLCDFSEDLFLRFEVMVEGAMRKV